MTKMYILTGPEMGQVFELRDGPSYVGRSQDNDIQILDKTVSRRHLKLSRKGDRYFITDLGSQNGTFVNGLCITSGIEIEVRQGHPIALGMTVICLGEGCMDQVMPFLDSIELTKETGNQSGIFVQHGERTNQRKLELLYKVSYLLSEKTPLNVTLEKILDHIFDLLRRIDRGAFILIDPETKDVTEIVSKSTKPGDEPIPGYCRDVVDQVIKNKQAVVVSDAHADSTDEIADTLRLLKIESVLCVPLVWSSLIMGVIYVDSMERPYGFQKEDLALFNDLGQRIALAMVNASLESDFDSVPEEL
ncbi:MAG: FHA domain-containing protein [Desulfobacterales bacterium]|nr:FHA domain-containing protein [Desulfobacterales bacterium]